MDIFSFHHNVGEIPSTSKHRQVFNISSEIKSGKLLNDGYLCVGPTVQPHLWDILLRFRQEKFIVKADTEKIKLQMKMNGENTKFCRNIWMSAPSEALKFYPLDSVTFWLSALSFGVKNSILLVALKFTERFSEPAKEIESYFDVDDFAFLFDFLEQRLRLLDKTRYFCLKIHASVREWIANSHNLIDELPFVDIKANTINAVAAVFKTHGILRKSFIDSTLLEVSNFVESRSTKADLMSQIASSLDPERLVSLVVVAVQLCVKMMTLLRWDKELPISMKEPWEDLRFKFTLFKGSTISGDAVINNSITAASLVLHEVHGTIVFLRSDDAIEIVQSSHLHLKSRVSLPKQMIARVELCTAASTSKRKLKIYKTPCSHIDDDIFFSFLIITLSWTAEDASKLFVFIVNYARVVQNITENYKWRPPSANCVSRGMKPDEIGNYVFWWNSCEFMKLPSDLSETISTIYHFDEDCLEETHNAFLELSTYHLLTLIGAIFGCFIKLINCLAANFVNRCQLLEIEAVANLIVITPVSDDLDDIEALTPVNSRAERSLIAKPGRNAFPERTNLVKYSPEKEKKCKKSDVKTTNVKKHVASRILLTF